MFNFFNDYCIFSVLYVVVSVSLDEDVYSEDDSVRLLKIYENHICELQMKRE